MQLCAPPWSALFIINVSLLFQTAPIFGGVLTVLVCLASASLLSVISYSALALLTAVAAAKIYAFVMIKMGKVEPGFDPLAMVCKIVQCTKSRCASRRWRT